MRELILNNKSLILQSRSFIDNGNIVYSRSCVWEERNAQKDACMSHSPPYGHTILACETCMEDNCNYKLISDDSDDSTYVLAFKELIFVCLAIVLII